MEVDKTDAQTAPTHNHDGTYPGRRPRFGRRHALDMQELGNEVECSDPSVEWTI